MNERDLRQMKRDIDRLRTAVAARPIKSAGGGTPSVTPPLHMAIGGNSFNTGSSTLAGGVAKRSDTVAGSELPAAGLGAGVNVIPAFPIPASLPLGVGVALNLFTGSHVFVVNDARGGYPGDIPIGRRMLVASSPVNLDRVDGADTSRYPCYVVATGI